jgi:SAM-dependent methyltransferase
MDSQYRDAARAWAQSAQAYIATQDAGDPNRTLLLDPVMLQQCGDVRGRRALDLGCGEGRFCRMLADRGADAVGVDITAALAQAAASRGGGRYLQSAAERLPFGDAAFDLVVSYITLVDIVGYREAIAECARVLRPGGSLLVASIGFVTASQGWQRDADGRRLYHRVDRYADEFAQTFEWAGVRIINWHRPLANYIQAYLGAGLILREFLEPVPADDSLNEHPDFEDWYRVPIFNVMRWQRP